LKIPKQVTILFKDDHAAIGIVANESAAEQVLIQEFNPVGASRSLPYGHNSGQPLVQAVASSGLSRLPSQIGLQTITCGLNMAPILSVLRRALIHLVPPSEQVVKRDADAAHLGEVASGAIVHVCAHPLLAGECRMGIRFLAQQWVWIDGGVVEHQNPRHDLTVVAKDRLPVDPLRPDVVGWPDLQRAAIY
jgi:hypothetical protein